MFDVNVFGVLNVIREFVRPMLEQRRGSIINISSGGSVGREAEEEPGVWLGRNPGFRNQPYDASKAALTNMSFYLAEELKPSNIAVNVVFPAGTRTTGSDEMAAGRAELGIRVGPLLRPEHVVPLVLYLAAQDAGTLTAQAIEAVTWNTRHGLGMQRRRGHSRRSAASREHADTDSIDNAHVSRFRRNPERSAHEVLDTRSGPPCTPPHRPQPGPLAAVQRRCVARCVLARSSDTTSRRAGPVACR